MTFGSLFRITLVSGSLWACVNQYQSPGGEVETSETSTESSEATPLPSEATDTPKEANAKPKEAPDEATRAPSETSGTCDDQTCVSASDCCKGYQCAFDPERSKVVRYCQPG